MIRLVLLLIASLTCLALPRAAPAATAGELDMTFGVGGKQHIEVPGLEQLYWSAVVRDSAGGIYLIASTDSDNEEDPNAPPVLTVARLHHDGALDLSYGMQGRVTTPLPPQFKNVSAAGMQPDGRIVLGFNNNSITALTSCRVLRSGALDPTYGDAETPGCSEVGPERTNYVSVVAVQADGHLVLAGTGVNVDGLGYRGMVARLTPAGELDQGFGDGGIVLLGGNSDTNLNDIAFAPEGDLILAGDIFSENSDFLVVRLDGITGQGVPGFGTFSIAFADFAAGSFDHDKAFAVQVLPDGGIVAAGYAQTDLAGVHRPAVLKLDSTGKPDESFAPGGKRVYDPCSAVPAGCEIWAHDIAALSGERLAITGSIQDMATKNRDFLALRILADGKLDTDFGNDSQATGSAVVPFDLGGQFGGPDSDSAYWILPDGERLLLVGNANVATGEPDAPDRDEFALARLDHGLTTTFTVTPKPGPQGAVSPATAQQVLHSDRAEFVVIPDSDYIVDHIEKGPGYCDGGMDGEVFVSAPVTQPCEVHLAFKRLHVFMDGYE